MIQPFFKSVQKKQLQKIAKIIIKIKFPTQQQKQMLNKKLKQVLQDSTIKKKDSSQSIILKLTSSHHDNKKKNNKTHQYLNNISSFTHYQSIDKANHNHTARKVKISNNQSKQSKSSKQFKYYTLNCKIKQLKQKIQNLYYINQNHQFTTPTKNNHQLTQNNQSTQKQKYSILQTNTDEKSINIKDTLSEYDKNHTQSMKNYQNLFKNQLLLNFKIQACKFLSKMQQNPQAAQHFQAVETTSDIFKILHQIITDKMQKNIKRIQQKFSKTATKNQLKISQQNIQLKKQNQLILTTLQKLQQQQILIQQNYKKISIQKQIFKNQNQIFLLQISQLHQEKYFFIRNQSNFISEKSKLFKEIQKYRLQTTQLEKQNYYLKNNEAHIQLQKQKLSKQLKIFYQKLLQFNTSQPSQQPPSLKPHPQSPISQTTLLYPQLSLFHQHIDQLIKKLQTTQNQLLTLQNLKIQFQNTFNQISLQKNILQSQLLKTKLQYQTKIYRQINIKQQNYLIFNQLRNIINDQSITSKQIQIPQYSLLQTINQLQTDYLKLLHHYQQQKKQKKLNFQQRDIQLKTYTQSKHFLATSYLTLFQTLLQQNIQLQAVNNSQQLQLISITKKMQQYEIKLKDLQNDYNSLNYDYSRDVKQWVNKQQYYQKNISDLKQQLIQSHLIIQQYSNILTANTKKQM